MGIVVVVVSPGTVVVVVSAASVEVVLGSGAGSAPLVPRLSM